MNTHLQKLNALLNHGCPKSYKPVEKNYENKFLFLIGTDKLFRTKVANASYWNQKNYTPNVLTI